MKKSRFIRFQRDGNSMKLLCKNLTIFLAHCLSLSFAQAPDTLWTRTYGGLDTDMGHSIQETHDDGYVIAGETYSFGSGNCNLYLIKIDANGTAFWTKTYAGLGVAYGNAVQETSDKGYIIVGHTMITDTSNLDVYLVKTDSLGDTLWTKTYGGDSHDDGSSVQQTSDGGYIIAGWTGSFGAGGYDIYVIKTDSMGAPLWIKTYGGSGYDIGQSVLQTADSGYIIVGYTNSYGAGSADVYIIKTDSIGNIIWTKTYGGVNPDFGHSIQQTIDNGYVITGSTESFGAGYRDIYLIRTNAYGDTIWTKTYGDSLGESGESVQESADHGFIITGYTQSFGAGYSDVYLIKTNVNGGTLWTKTYGGVNDDMGLSVQQASDSGYIIAGGTLSAGMGGEVYVIKTAPDTLGLEECQTTHPSFVSPKCYPNPVKKEYNIEYILPQIADVNISIYDMTGRLIKEVLDDNQNAGFHLKTLDMTALPQGVYFIRLMVVGRPETKKVIFIK